MSNDDRLLYSAPQGTAVRYAAEQRDLPASIAELREMADGRSDVLAEAAGITAGSWYASPATHVGHELSLAECLSLLAVAAASHSTTTNLRLDADGV